jgi:Flp pilus assembly protein TadG
MSLFKAFGIDRRGATAIIWAVTLLPLFVISGAAIDLTRQATAERHLRSATDAAAVAGVRYALSISENPDDVTAEAARFFQENLPPQWSALGITPEIVYVPGESVTVNAQFPLETTMLGLANIPALEVGALSEAVYGAGGPIEVALVLDNSYSMVGAPMDDLKEATRSFVDTLVESGDDEVKISIVPFNNFVNVGTGHRNEPWIDVPDDFTPPGTHCSADHDATVAQGCYLEPKTCYSDGQPYDCSEWVCPDGVDPVETCSAHALQTWHGCVLARGVPLDVEDASYTTDTIRGRLDWSAWGCPTPILPLTDDADQLEDSIEAMVAKSETMIYEGLAWGYRTLTPSAPFNEGRAFAAMDAQNGEKVLVLMSDGANSRSPDPDNGNTDHWWQDIDHANSRTQAACDEIRDAGIQIHVIALGLTDDDTLDLLRDCAGNPANFHAISDSGDLEAVFQGISGNIREIALAR